MVVLNRSDSDGNALDRADERLLPQLNRAVLDHEFVFCNGIGLGEIADERHAKNSSIHGVNGDFAVIPGHLLEETTSDATEFHLIVGRALRNLEAEYRHCPGRSPLPVTPRQVAVGKIGEDGGEDRTEFTDCGQATHS